MVLKQNVDRVDRVLSVSVNLVSDNSLFEILVVVTQVEVIAMN